MIHLIRPSHWVATAVALYITIGFGDCRGIGFDYLQATTGSMLPTIAEGDRILIDRSCEATRNFMPEFASRIRDCRPLRRGDIVLYIYPLDLTTRYVKRVIGLPGDTVMITNCDLYINGKLMLKKVVPASQNQNGNDQVQYLEDIDGQGARVLCGSNRNFSFGPVVVHPESLFVLGDNRMNSADSRQHGSIPIKLIEGRITHILLPSGGFQIARNPYREFGLLW